MSSRQHNAVHKAKDVVVNAVYKDPGESASYHVLSDRLTRRERSDEIIHCILADCAGEAEVVLQRLRDTERAPDSAIGRLPSSVRVARQPKKQDV